jgi:uncharacterized protein (DUF305 family)
MADVHQQSLKVMRAGRFATDIITFQEAEDHLKLCKKCRDQWAKESKDQPRD